MDRRQFSRNVLQEELGFTPQQLEYLFAMPGKKVFEVVFATYDFFEQCVERFMRKKLNNPSFENINIIPLSERDSKTLTVIVAKAFTSLIRRCPYMETSVSVAICRDIRIGAHVWI